ncbi:hypothetical protein HU200_051492 [Digitaria exilis]|uniref:DUF6598 domain-containing protein n=1 Tax=Digitaria exilis TaxID=1010633 RepID=A0A835EA46_9POAL|nr:hypothetical protein HU200_051492 [Digitaria exilis]
MMLSNPIECMFYGATCRQHRLGRMLQIFSLKLAKIQVAEGGPVELYGYRIKTGKQEKDDLQLIDSVSLIDEMTTFARKPFTRRIHGDRGAVDITLSCVNDAVEATIEIVVSEVQSNFSLCVGCFISRYNSDNDAEHCCTFKATNHGYTSQLVKVKFATVLVKVTWSTLSMLP